MTAESNKQRVLGLYESLARRDREARPAAIADEVEDTRVTATFGAA